MQQIYCALFLLFLFISPLQALKNTKLSAEDIATLLTNTLQQYHESLIHAPADITFAVADLKYNHGTFKIIECGNGPYCGLKPHPIMVNNKIAIMTTPYWQIIDKLLNKYNIPVWFTGLPLPEPFQYFLKPPTTDKIGLTLFKDLINTPFFCRPEARSITKPKKIADHQGIVLYRGSGLKAIGMDNFFEFKKNYPAFLLINSNSCTYFSCKKATYQLFSDAGLSDYLPRHAIYPINDYQNVADHILHDFPLTQSFVIKPLGKYRSFGVGIVPAEHLHEHINHMFGADQVQPYEAKSIGYWRKNKDTHFMVNEFIPSQTIIYNHKPYDSTMRIVMLMTHEAGMITINIIGGCWKIPPHAIDDEKASFTQRHATDPDRHETDDGVLIAPDDLAAMKAVVAPVFAQAYKTILEHSILKATK